MISNSFTPYRVNYHRRIAAEVPEMALHSVFTHEESSSPWPATGGDEIGAVVFGPGETAPTRVAVNPHEWRKAGRIVSYLRENRVEAVVLCGYSDVGRVRIMFACRRQGIRLFMNTDSNIKCDTASGAKRLLKTIALRTVLRWCSGILVCGSLGEQYYRRYGVDPSRIFVTPFEPNYRLFEGTGAVARTTGGRRGLLFSGRLAPEKRVDLLVTAFTRIAHLRPMWDLVIVGDGPDRASLRELVPPGLVSRVRWHEFTADDEALAALYRTADVLVLPSDFEPWGIVVTEAAAAGLALVTSDVVGASPELIRQGVNGSRFGAGSEDSLVRALLDVTEEDRVDQMKEASKAVFRTWRKDNDPVAGLRRALDLPPTGLPSVARSR